MKLLSTLSLSLLALTAAAQVTGPGFYRASSNPYGRYITVIDNRTKGANYQTSSVDVNALRTIRPFDERVVNDPATVLYFESKGTNSSGDSLYDLCTQGMTTYSIVSTALALKDNGNGTYRAYGQQNVGGTTWTVYLRDSQTDNADIAYVQTATSQALNWTITPVSAASDNYFGLKPTVSIDGKYYTTLYADFAFRTYSPGMRVYYIDAVKDGAGTDYAELREITGLVPARTPVIVECSSNQATDNRLELSHAANSAPTDNILKGVWFENVTVYDVGVNSGHRNALDYDASTMRVLGKVDGKLGFVTSKTLQYVPANSAYLTVPAGWDEKLLCLTPDDYAASISSVCRDAIATSPAYNLMGQPVTDTSAPGIYIIGGKKVVVK